MKQLVALFVFMVASVFAAPAFGQTLVAPEDSSEVDSTVEVVVRAEPGSEWYILVDSNRVASMRLDETGVAKQTIWLGAITNPLSLRVEKTDGSSPFDRRLIPRGWAPGDVAKESGPETSQRDAAVPNVARRQSPNSTLRLGFWTIASTLTGYVGGYALAHPVVQPVGFRDGRPTVTGSDRLFVQYMVAGSVLLGVGATNFFSSYIFLEGDPLLPAGLPLMGIATLIVLGYAAPDVSDETIDATSLGIAYGGTALSALALYVTSPGSFGSGALLPVSVFPSRDGATISVGGRF